MVTNAYWYVKQGSAFRKALLKNKKALKRVQATFGRYPSFKGSREEQYIIEALRETDEALAQYPEDEMKQDPPRG